MSVKGETIGKIGRGFLVLAGFRKGDNEADIKRLSDKCINLRVFEDDEGKMNLSLQDIGGELLVVSQFTLYANCKKGRRPGFDNSMPPDEAEIFYDSLLKEMAASGLKVDKGIFGAKMEISLTNDGPVTIMLDGDEI